MQELHPCFSGRAHARYARIHLPVARDCNLGCNYCERLIGGASYHSYRPAVCDRIIAPTEALACVKGYCGAGELRVAGIAGPGEPLYNEETFQTLQLIGRSFPRLILCLSTNGLLLSNSLSRLIELGVGMVTVTVNTVDPGTAGAIYSHAIVDGHVLKGRAAAKAIVDSQIPGVRRAAGAGLLVKVNTILMPGINQDEIAQVARAAREAGACIQNVIPLIPLGGLRDRRPPSCFELSQARREAAAHLEQFTRCRQCRADSVGVPGKTDSVLNVTY